MKYASLLDKIASGTYTRADLAKLRSNAATKHAAGNHTRNSFGVPGRADPADRRSDDQEGAADGAGPAASPADSASFER